MNQNLKIINSSINIKNRNNNFWLGFIPKKIPSLVFFILGLVCWIMIYFYMEAAKNSSEEYFWQNSIAVLRETESIIIILSGILFFLSEYFSNFDLIKLFNIKNKYTRILASIIIVTTSVLLGTYIIYEKLDKLQGLPGGTIFVGKTNNQDQTKIIISSPSVDDVWETGQTYKIKWSPNNTNETVGIILEDKSMPGGSIGKVWQVDDIPNIGEYSFTVPQLLTEGPYQFYISTNKNYAYSDVFLINNKDITANLFTYVNDYYGFRFNYSNNYSLKESNNNYVLIANKENPDLNISVFVKNDTEFYNKETKKLESTSILSFKDFAINEVKTRICPAADGPSGSIYCTDITEIESFKNNQGIEGYKVSIKLIHETYDNWKKTGIIKEEVMGPIFLFDVSQQTQNKARSIIFQGKTIDQMVSTFSFNNKKDIAKISFENYLNQYLSETEPEENQLIDYVINNINVINSSVKENCFSFLVTFSVKPYLNPSLWKDGDKECFSMWIPGNGTIKNEWITNKYISVDVFRENNEYSVKEITGTAYTPHECDN